MIEKLQQHLESHQILSTTAKIKAMNLSNIISSASFFVKKKVSFQEHNGTKEQKVGSSLRNPQVCHAGK